MTKCSADNTPRGQTAKPRGQTAGHELVGPTGHDQPLLAEGSRERVAQRPAERPAQGTGQGLWHEAASRVPRAAVPTGRSGGRTAAREGWATLLSGPAHRTGFRAEKQKMLGNPGRKRMTTRSRWTCIEGRGTAGKKHGLQ